jgi:hypothetical protein
LIFGLLELLLLLHHRQTLGLNIFSFVQEPNPFRMSLNCRFKDDKIYLNLYN